MMYKHPLSTHDAVDIASRLLHERPISFHPVYADVMGSAAGGLALSQLLYWAHKMDGWFYKTDAEFRAETRLSEREWKKAKAAFKNTGFVETKLMGVPARTHYKVNFVALIDTLGYVHFDKLDGTGCPSQFGQGVLTGSVDVVQTNTETTQETTQKNNKKEFGQTPRQKAKAIPLPDSIQRQPWEDWVDHRFEMQGKPPTPSCVATWIKKLERLASEGQDPAAVIAQSIERNWSGLFAVKGTAPPAPDVRITDYEWRLFCRAYFDMGPSAWPKVKLQGEFPGGCPPHILDEFELMERQNA